MPLFYTDFKSNYLLEQVKMNIYIPDNFQGALQNLKVLFLFHGMAGNENSWINLGDAIKTADLFNKILVMPNLNNSFGVNMLYGNDYEYFIIKEVYEYVHNWFNLSRKKEDNWIAGLSMGGYVAFNLGIKYQHLFSYIGAFSLPADLHKLVNHFPKSPITKKIIENVFGNGDFMNSSLNVLNQASFNNILPETKIYLYCGQKDEFYLDVKKLFNILKDRKINVTLKEDDGGHEWNRWEQRLKEFLREGKN